MIRNVRNSIMSIASVKIPHSVPLWLLGDTACGLACRIHYTGSWFWLFWPSHRFLDTWQWQVLTSTVTFCDSDPTPKLDHQRENFLWLGTTRFVVIDLAQSIASSISRIQGISYKLSLQVVSELPLLPWRRVLLLELLWESSIEFNMQGTKHVNGGVGKGRETCCHS